jgi:SNF2 family DNA or RNA helicase
LRTYGTAVLSADGRQWHIVCDAHVLIRLKRHFGKVAPLPGGVRLSNNDENCRELEWFAQRYPLVFDPPGEVTRRSAAHRENAERVQEILFGNYLPPSISALAVPAREYQQLAAALVLQNRSLLVADDVGLGKTVTAIATFTDPRTLPVLVVTLTHLPRQWEAMIARFAPRLRVHTISTGQPYDIAERYSKEVKRKKLVDSATGMPVVGGFPDVLLINYHKLSGWSDALSGVVKHIVFDECQELRRSGSLKFAAAQAVAHACEFRMGLSATPIYNYGGEIFNVLDTLHPNKLGSRAEFLREWCGGINSPYFDDNKAKITNPRAFGTYVEEEGLMIRRTRSEVRRELPAITKTVQPIDADTAALDRVGKVAAELARVILARNEAFKGQKWKAAEEFSNRVRQATGIAKAPFVADFVRLLVESGEQILLYGWHREVYSIWLDRLKDLNPMLFTGSESPNQKAEAVARFSSGESKVLCMSLRAGAGVDGLQNVCRTVVKGELDWSPGVHEQCEGRIYRDGQPDPVMVYYLVSEFGSDPTMIDVLGVKRQQIYGIRDPRASVVETYQRDDDHVKRLAAAYLQQRGLSSYSDAAHTDASSLGISLDGPQEG